jgi:hypothetical protein
MSRIYRLRLFRCEIASVEIEDDTEEHTPDHIDGPELYWSER